MKVDVSLMCEEAEEIQEAWKPKIGDLMFARNLLPHQPRIYLLTHFIDNNGKDASSGRIVVYNIKTYQESCDSSVDELKKYFVWLPSQKDLQEMFEQHLQKHCDIAEYTFNIAYTFEEVEEFLKTFFYLTTAGRIKEGWYPKSWVQLWLAFVYHELYGKRWNPDKKKWEKIND